MFKITRRFALAALLALVPLTANALGVSVVNVSNDGTNPNGLESGDIVTIDLALENSGAGGGSTGAGDVHFQIQFAAESLLVPNLVTLEFGVFPEFGMAAVGDGGQQLAFAGTTLDLYVVPEPGTALLFGLGLAGLAARRR